MITKALKVYFTHLIKISPLAFRRYVHANLTKYSSRADYRMAPNVFRQKKIYPAIVEEVFTASPSIKILRLNVKEQGFSFKAGQWVDFYVPGITEVTGYSMTSAPNEARKKGVLELSIKYGTFPPTHWVHNSCLPGQEVHIRVGGDFYYDPFSNKTEAEANLLLVGGGVGINPLVSILYEYTDLLVAAQNKSSVHPGKVHLLYSAKTEEELVFKDLFTTMEKEHPTLFCQYFVTMQPGDRMNPSMHYCRIGEQHVTNSISQLGKQTLCYVCGPSTMTDEVASWLLKLGIDKDNIRFEKWW